MFTIVSIIRLCFFVDSNVLVVHYSRPFPARFVSVVSVFSAVSFRWFRYLSWFRFGGLGILVGFVSVVWVF